MTKPGQAWQAIGIDGCPGGWFYVSLSPAEPPGFGILSHIRDMPGLMGPRTRVLLDIPMGLKEEGREERSCDRMARKLLGKRGTSVFPVPARPALGLSDYAQASAVNQACTGRKLSIQTFNIMKKIHEVDGFLGRLESRDQFMESHPELVFLSLNRFEPLSFSKKTAQGRDQRLDILEAHLPAAQDVYERAASAFPRKEAALDDILDAMALAVAAEMPLAQVPDSPPLDALGIPMQIVYPRIS